MPPAKEAERTELHRTIKRIADDLRELFDDPTAYKFNHPDPYTPSGSYSCALADVTGDGLPELLLQADVTDYFAPVTVFGKPAEKQLFNVR